MDGGAWWATVHGVTKSWTQLSNFTFTFKIREDSKEIKDTKGRFQAKMGTTKDRNSMHLTEAEDIKKRWQEYTELYT